MLKTTIKNMHGKIVEKKEMELNQVAYVNSLFENFEHLIAKCNIEIKVDGKWKNVTYFEYKISNIKTDYTKTVADIREKSILKPMSKSYTEADLKKKLEKTVTKTNRKNEVLCHIVFDKVEFTESENGGYFTENEVNYIIQSAFRRAELNHVHNKKKLTTGDDKGKISAMFSNIDNKYRYIDKFKLMEEYDNCFNEFYCQILKMQKRNDKIFVFRGGQKLDRVKELICRLAYQATNAIEKAVYEMAYYKSSKLKAQREFLKNCVSVNDDTEKNETDTKTSVTQIEDQQSKYEYDYINIITDMQKMFTGSAYEILKLKLKGKTHREIAEELGTSTKTIQKTLNEVKAYLLDKQVEKEYIEK